VEGIPCVGIWGTFDVENYGDHLFVRVAEHELSRRLGPVELRAFSPYGWLHPTRLDGGEPAEPLGRWERARVVELAAELHCVLVGGGEIIHTHDELLAPAYGVGPQDVTRIEPSRWFIEGLGPDLERTTPVVWHAVGVPFDPTPHEAERFRAALASRNYVAVRDERSRERLVQSGVSCEITVVPDSALLLSRVLPDEVLDRRLAFLRRMGWYPGDGKALVVQGNRDMLAFVPEIAAALDQILVHHADLQPVLIQTGVCHGDGDMAGALEAALSRRVFRLPPEVGVEDIAAAISRSAAFVGSSLHGCITALAFGRPFLVLNLDAQSKLDGFADLADRDGAVARAPTEVGPALERVLDQGADAAPATRLQRQVDDHFDRVATIVETTSARRDHTRDDGPSSPHTAGRLEAEIRTLRSAHEAQAHRIRAERLRLADHMKEVQEELLARRAAVADLQAALEESNASADEAQVRASEAEREIRSLQNTRTFRYLAAPRRTYSRIRRLWT
jgi:polysaccharide pyruvyl transferase WcaK-like protein